MSYPLKFRQQVFEIKKKDGLTFLDTSKRFGIGISTLFRWQRKIEPCLTRDKSATKINMKNLNKDVKKYPDAYQYERAKRFGVSANAILYALRRLAISHKKNPVSS